LKEAEAVPPADLTVIESIAGQKEAAELTRSR
jgi:hypothetical protein